MRIDKVVEGIHRIEDAYVNLYVLQEGREFTVVDAGLPRSWGGLERLLFSLGRPLSAVSALVLTHAHFDHVGFAGRLRARGTPVLVHHDDAPLLRHPFRYDHERSRLRYLSPGFARVLGAMTAAGAPRVRGTQATGSFTDGDALDVPGRPRVVATPGHTYGHCSLFLPDAGAVITGDALVTYDIYAQRRGPCIVAGGATASSPRALASLDRLTDLQADTILTGHGPLWRGLPADAVARAREAGPA